ncbi:MAG TPA: ABC transporter ATP-binding protein [Acidobacteriaceae bacterium]|nr:ABC transporter ATP-binding protein [Acidobacteriaceae bacterium]
MAPLVEIKDLSIKFGERAAVRGLSITIQPGRVLGLVGESGSGKSVTALAVMRLLDATARVEGSILFDGKEILSLDRESMRRLRGRDMAMVFQEPMTALNPVMPVGDQVAEAVRAHHPEFSRRRVRDAVLEAMDAVALPDMAERYRDYPHQFSGGQRQRILIAMAIVNHPRLLIADEPTTALDVTVQKQILELLADLRKRYGLTMLFISHDLAVVSQVADSVAVMRQGVLVEEGTCADIFLKPEHPHTRALLGAVPTMTTSLDAPLAVLERSTDIDQEIR